MERVARCVPRFVCILFLFVSVHQTRVDEASQFDFCDREQHFAIEMPQRARSCRTLYNTILALSARHLSQISEFDPITKNV